MKKVIISIFAMVLSLSMAFSVMAEEPQNLLNEEVTTVVETTADEPDYQIPENVTEEATVPEGPTEEAAAPEETTEETVTPEETTEETAAPEESTEETAAPEDTTEETAASEETTVPEESSENVTTSEKTSETESTSEGESTSEEESSSEETTEVFEIGYWINPIVEPYVDTDELLAEFEALKAEYEDIPPVLDAATYYDNASAASYVRSQMVARSNRITFTVYLSDITEDNLTEQSNDILDKAMAYTGNGCEGDYLTCHFTGLGSDSRAYPAGKNIVTYDLYLTYMTNASEEAKVTSKLNSVYSSLGLSSLSTYEKIVTIYKYICDHISYDHAHLNNTSYYLKYTAYAGLINGTCVCQGFANLFYRMALDNGIPSRIILGNNHSWNVAKCDGMYYYLDATWDEENSPDGYNYFMLGSSEFLKTHATTYTVPAPGSSSLNISSKNLNYLKLNKTKATVVIGSKITIKATPYPNCYSPSLKWSSSNTSVATVSSSGLVTAKGYGKATISVTTTNGVYVGECTIQTRFRDVTDSSSGFYKPIYWAANNGIAAGGSDGYFGAANACSRKQLVLMLYRYAGKPEVSGSLSFKDCNYDKSSETYKAILWAYKKGIIGGYNNGKLFKPDATITRKQAMLMLYRYAGKPSVSGTMTFKDCKYSKSSDSYKAILWGVKKGITNGTSDTTFSPNSTCLRRQIIFFLYRYAHV